MDLYSATRHFHGSINGICDKYPLFPSSEIPLSKARKVNVMAIAPLHKKFDAKFGVPIHLLFCLFFIVMSLSFLHFDHKLHPNSQASKGGKTKSPAFMRGGHLDSCMQIYLYDFVRPP